MRAMFSAVTGIRSHQVRMDVIGNNIANVNTAGFKAGRTTFQDLFSQTIGGGSGTSSPLQVGLGVGVGSIDQVQAAGSLQMTGRDLDLALEGAGLFVLRRNNQTFFSRAGSFDWDPTGVLVSPATGQRVQGWMAAPDGTIAIDPASMGDIRLPRGEVSLARATTRAAFGKNLDAGADLNTSYTTGLNVYDSQGQVQSVRLQFTKTANNTWSWGVVPPGGGAVTSQGTLTFGADGKITGTTTGAISVAGQTVTLDFSKVTQVYLPGGSTLMPIEVDGYPAGTLVSVGVDAQGVITGVYSNGVTRPLAQIAVATFTNPSGLSKVGSNAYSVSIASGQPDLGAAGTGERGRVVTGNLEMSNVDLSNEFTNMIMTQRGFQANTRVISAADEMLQDLVNLKR